MENLRHLLSAQAVALAQDGDVVNEVAELIISIVDVHKGPPDEYLHIVYN